eukprot:RCo001509
MHLCVSRMSQSSSSFLNPLARPSPGGQENTSSSDVGTPQSNAQMVQPSPPSPVPCAQPTLRSPKFFSAARELQMPNPGHPEGGSSSHLAVMAVESMPPTREAVVASPEGSPTTNVHSFSYPNNLTGVPALPGLSGLPGRSATIYPLARGATISYGNRSRRSDTVSPTIEAMARNILPTTRRGGVARFLLSLRVLLAVFCVIVIFAATFLAWYLTYTQSLDTVRELFLNFQAELVPLLSESVEGYLSRAQVSVHLVKDNFRTGAFSSTPSSYLPFLHSLLSTTNFTSDLFVAPYTGGMVGYFRDPAGVYTSTWTFDTETKNLTEWYTDAEGHPVSLFWTRIALGSYRDWYPVNESDRGFSTWTPQYVWYGRLWLTYYTGIYSPEGELLGVTGSDLELGFLNSILKGFGFVPGYSVYVLDVRFRRLVASYPALPTLVSSTGTMVEQGCPNGTLSQVDPLELHDPALDSIYATIQAEFRSWEAVAFYAGTTRVAGAPYYCVFQPIAQRNLRWVIVLLASQEVLLAPVYDKTKMVLGLVGSIIAATAVASLVFSALVVRPLDRLSQHMWDLATLDPAALDEEDSSERHPPVFSEVLGIHMSFYAMRRAILAFSKYVPRKLVQQLLAQNSTVSLGMSPVLVSIMFIDIVDFTKLCEGIAPARLVELMNEYLQMICGVVHGSGGTVDKFIGDAVMSFWNAPQEVPEHPMVACQAALGIGEILGLMNREWAERRLPTLAVRIGLHCGKVLVGNVGCADRMNYTVLGDGVNLTSRLEGLGKLYQACTVVSNAIYWHVHEAFLMYPLDIVVVKGKSARTPVYELVCPRAVATPQQLELAEALATANKLMAPGDFSGVVHHVKVAQRRGLNHAALEVLLARAEANLRDGTTETANVLSSK